MFGLYYQTYAKIAPFSEIEKLYFQKNVFAIEHIKQRGCRYLQPRCLFSKLPKEHQCHKKEV